MSRSRLPARSGRRSKSQSRSAVRSRRVCRVSSSRATGATAHVFTSTESPPKPPPELHSDPTFIKGPNDSHRIAGDIEGAAVHDRREGRVLRQPPRALTITLLAPGHRGGGHRRWIAARRARPRDLGCSGRGAARGVHDHGRRLRLGEGCRRNRRLISSGRRSCTVVEEIVRPKLPQPTSKNKNRTAEGPQVALLWRHGDQVELLPKNPGKVEEVPAIELARRRASTRSSRARGDAGAHDLPERGLLAPEEVSRGRQRELTKIGSGHAYNRYAIDVGVALLVIHHEKNSDASGASTWTKHCLRLLGKPQRKEQSASCRTSTPSRERRESMSSH